MQTHSFTATNNIQSLALPGPDTATEEDRCSMSKIMGVDNKFN